MNDSDIAVDRQAGLHNVVDIVISPQAAFARLRLVPTWWWAFLAASVMGIAGFLLAAPATMHALNTWLPGMLAKNPRIAGLSPEKQAAQVASILGFTRTIAQLSWIFIPFVILVAGLVQGLVMTVADKVGHGSGTFARYFSLSVTVAIVGVGLSSLVVGIIATLRGPASFDDPGSIQLLVPSLALLAPGTHGAVRGFLSAFNVFYLWSAVLLALGMIAIGRISRATAWGTSALLLLLGAALTAFNARQS